MTEKDFIQHLYEQHRITKPGLNLTQVGAVADQAIQLLFPVLCDKVYPSLSVFEEDFLNFKNNLRDLLSHLAEIEGQEDAIIAAFLKKLPPLLKIMEGDANAILSGDPAAVNHTEVIRTYPGFYAIAIYRIAHQLCQLGTPFLPRMLTEYGHNKTGIDIHPKATIGERFCIDHGTGVVIGETVIIGNDVKLYQGVTLGALSVTKQMAKTKRHPTIGDRVLIYANATILGGKTVIGADSIIGGNVWITKSVPAFSRIYYKASNTAKKEKAPPQNNADKPKAK